MYSVQKTFPVQRHWVATSTRASHDPKEGPGDARQSLGFCVSSAHFHVAASGKVGGRSALPHALASWPAAGALLWPLCRHRTDGGGGVTADTRGTRSRDTQHTQTHMVLTHTCTLRKAPLHSEHTTEPNRKRHESPVPAPCLAPAHTEIPRQRRSGLFKVTVLVRAAKTDKKQ